MVKETIILTLVKTARKTSLTIGVQSVSMGREIGLSSKYSKDGQGFESMSIVAESMGNFQEDM